MNSVFTLMSVGNGHLRLPLSGRKHFVVFGGPFSQRPTLMRGINLRAEARQLACDCYVPIKDFSIPSIQDAERGLEHAINWVLKGEPLYVGCMGGIGRTGLFLALLAKAFGVKQPVEYVREHYFSRAVETKEQEKFVADFEIPEELKAKIFWAKVKNWFSFRRENLTQLPKTVS